MTALFKVHINGPISRISSLDGPITKTHLHSWPCIGIGHLLLHHNPLRNPVSLAPNPTIPNPIQRILRLISFNHLDYHLATLRKSAVAAAKHARSLLTDMVSFSKSDVDLCHRTGDRLKLKQIQYEWEQRYGKLSSYQNKNKIHWLKKLMDNAGASSCFRRLFFPFLLPTEQLFPISLTYTGVMNSDSSQVAEQSVSSRKNPPRRSSSRSTQRP